MLINFSIGLLWLIAMIQGVVIVALVHQLAALRALANAGGPVIAELPIGGLAPEFVATDLQSSRRVHSSTLSGRRVVMCFMTGDCYVCRTLAFELSRKSAEALAGLVIYYESAVGAGSTVFQSLASKICVLCKDDVDVSAQFHLSKFPVAVVIDEAWRIAGVSHPVRADDLLTLLTGSRDQAASTASALTEVAG